MSARLLSFDVETTGKNPEVDEIIELSICLEGQTAADAWTRRFKPSVSITPGAFRVHGISAEMLQDAPPFSSLADEIQALFEIAEVIVGYNVRFDIRFIEAAFDRLDRPSPLGKTLIVDPFRIWQSMEPRRLESAFERFVGGNLENAHSAADDAFAALQVLDGMRQEFDLRDMPWEDMAVITDPDRTTWIGPTKHFRWEGDSVVFGFGKHDGRSIFEVDPGYLRWIQKTKDFPAHVDSLCKGALSGIDAADFVARVREFYGGPPDAQAASLEAVPSILVGSDSPPSS